MNSQTDANYVQVARQAFSYTGQARDYLLYRPTYPASFFTQYVAELAAEGRRREDEREARGEPRRKVVALDFGCGSGQATAAFLPYFDRVIGVDMNRLQLDQAEGRFAAEIAAGSVQFWEADCSRLDEVIAERLPSDCALALITVCQAFHWFDERDLLVRCRRALAPFHGAMAVLGYKLFTMLPSPRYDAELFARFDAEVRVHFAFDPDQLDNLYRDKNFAEYFPRVTFHRDDVVYQNYPVRDFLGYLGTLSGYRCKLEKIDKSPADDSLRRLSDALGLAGYQRGDASGVSAPPGAPATVDFVVPFFMYVLRD